MNKIERVVDRIDPGLGARLRVLKLSLHHHVTWRLIKNMIGPAEVGVDVGANRGVCTYMMSVRAGAEGHIHPIDALASLEHDQARTEECCTVSLRTLDELLAGVESTFRLFADAGYRGWFVAEHGLRPLAEFDVARDQLDFLDGQFVPYGMPSGYVCDFLFWPPDAQPLPANWAGIPPDPSPGGDPVPAARKG